MTTPSSAVAFRRSATRARFARRAVALVLAVGLVITMSAVVDVAPDLDPMIHRLSVGIIVSVSVALLAAVGLAVAGARRSAREREWYQAAFGSDEDAVLATLDHRYLRDLVARATSAPRSADVAFGTVAYRYPCLPDRVTESLLVRARGWAAGTIPDGASSAPRPSPMRGPLARLAERTNPASRQRLRTAAKSAAIALLLCGVVVFFPIASIAESALLQAAGVLLVVLAGAVFIANSLWTSVWIPRADYRQVYGSDPDRVLDSESRAFAESLVDAAGDGSESVMPAAVLVHSRFPMVVGFDAVDVVRAAQRRLRG